MGTSIDQLLAEADQEIKGSLEKAASQKESTETSSAGQPYSDEEPVKLAHFLEDFAENGEVESSQTQQPPRIQEKQASSEDDSEIENTMVAKLAHAMALCETAANIETLKKTAEFVKKAEAAGHSEEQINEFLEKQAKKMPGAGTIAKAMAALGIGGAGGAIAGREYGQEEGRKEGRKKGYVQGVRDYHTAMKRRYGMNQ